MLSEHAQRMLHCLCGASYNTSHGALCELRLGHPAYFFRYVYSPRAKALYDLLCFSRKHPAEFFKGVFGLGVHPMHPVQCTGFIKPLPSHFGCYQLNRSILFWFTFGRVFSTALPARV